MATGGDRFSDNEYINWLTATLSLMYMKEGLEEFTLKESVIFHKQLLRSLGKATCKGNCSSRDIKKDFRNQRWYMTCSVCDPWLQSALSFHRNAPFPKLSPDNTHPTLWQTEPWETMKLFAPFGCESDLSANDADIQGILSLFINCKHFSTGRHIGRHDLLDKLVGIRNSLLHSANFKVSETDVKNHLQTALLFLQGITGLTGREKDTLEAAVEKIKQLDTNQIEISVNKELEIRALKERQAAVDRDLKGLRILVGETKKEQDDQSTEFKQHKEIIKELRGAKRKFDEFLETNDLVHDVSKLSKRVGDIAQTVARQDERICTLENRIQSKTEAHTSSLTDLEEQCKELQQHLLFKYEEENMDWENPVTSEEARLSDMYVQPSVKCIREINEHREMKEVSQCSELMYKDIFKSETGRLCKNIYIAGDAGYGKSTFCNQLVMNWCSAVQNKPDHSLTNEDQILLSSFRFLFHISLRDTEATYHVADMIQEQLLFNAPVSLNISDILKTEKCLIILDGLDEWSCPGDANKCPNINKDIPGRNTANKNCVFITTTRMWKYAAIGLKNRDVDKHVELSGIGEQSSDDLAQRMLDYLDRDSQTNKTVDDFYSEIAGKNLHDFLSVPVLLIQLITLWFFGKDFGNSQLQLYCSMLDLMFERSEKQLPEEFSISCITTVAQCSNTVVATSKPLPECFSMKYNCHKYAELLRCLSRVAYKALFNKNKESALVFRSSRLEIFGISPSNIKLCLQCGILSQCRDYGNRTGKYKKFSFLHKKVQECLAALYLVTNDNIEDILGELKQFCNSIEVMLEVNQVLLFVAGMDPDMTRQLLEHLAHVVSADERIKRYRQTVDETGLREPDCDFLIFDIQKWVSGCVSEGINNGHHYENIYLEDFHISYLVIDSNNIRDAERLLFCSDMSKVKSVFLYTSAIDDAKLAAITGQFLRCHSLQKLDLNDRDINDIYAAPIPDSTVKALVDNNCDSLTSLSLETNFMLTDDIVTSICSSIGKSLKALSLHEVNVTHEHKEQILDSLSQSTVIRQFKLGLYCTVHREECGDRIDWSGMTQLQKIILTSSMYVDNLQSLPHCVELVVLRWAILSMTSLCDFVRELSQTRRKMTIELEHITFIETREECGDLEVFLTSCPGLELTKCMYDDNTWRHGKDKFYNTWEIEFHTSKQ